jgi:hypothetical protein
VCLRVGQGDLNDMILMWLWAMLGTIGCMQSSYIRIEISACLTFFLIGIVVAICL